MHTPYQESTLLGPNVKGAIISSSRIPLQPQGSNGGTGGFGYDAGNATIKTDGALNHHRTHHKKHNDKNSNHAKTLKRIQFDESIATEDDLKNMTEEEVKSRRREANLMALVKRAATRSQASICEEHDEGEKITINSVAKQF